jgi:hypothetical protein
MAEAGGHGERCGHSVCALAYRAPRSIAILIRIIGDGVERRDCKEITLCVGSRPLLPFKRRQPASASPAEAAVGRDLGTYQVPLQSRYLQIMRQR